MAATKTRKRTTKKLTAARAALKKKAGPKKAAKKSARKPAKRTAKRTAKTTTRRRTAKKSAKRKASAKVGKLKRGAGYSSLNTLTVSPAQARALGSLMRSHYCKKGKGGRTVCVTKKGVVKAVIRHG